MALAENTVDILNELMVLHYRSFAMYLLEASPWKHRGDEKATEVLGDIIADQQETCRRIAEVIIARGGYPERGAFPTEWTDTHFLSLDYLLTELIAAQQRDIAAIQRAVDRLWNDPPAQSLAKEALGAAKGHLQSLEELVAETTATG
jgi:hypothetical protein